jgi:hypothetical protein
MKLPSARALLLLTVLLAVCVAVAQAYEDPPDAPETRALRGGKVPKCPPSVKPFPGPKGIKRGKCPGKCKKRHAIICLDGGGGRLRGGGGQCKMACALDWLDGDGWGWYDW